MEPPENVSGVAGKEARLECRSRGDPPITVTWNKAGVNVMGGGDPRHLLETENIPGGIRSILTIRSLQVSDGGRYQCIISNPHGSASASIDLEIQGKTPLHISLTD